MPSNFQAVVLAGGPGSRIPDLVPNVKPKCILPIGPYPLIWYPLQMLQSHGFQDCIVIVQETQKSEIQQTLEKLPFKIKIDYVSLPAESDLGTADALIHIRDRIKYDVLLVSCDTITDVNLFGLLNTFRQHDASVTSLLFHGGNNSTAVIPGPKTKTKPDRDLIGLHSDSQRLLFLASTSDFEEDIKFSSRLLNKNGKMVLHSNLLDSHIYVLKKWIIDFLCDNPGFSTVKGELIPYIVKKQMSRPVIVNSETYKPMSEVNVNVKKNDIFNFVSSSEIGNKITETSMYNDSRSKDAYNSDIIRCYAVTAPKDAYGIRVNTMQSFCKANSNIFGFLQKLQPDAVYISPSSVINSTQMSNTCVNDNTFISEKTSIKGTIIGSNCKINEKVRITDSIIMNNVIIESGVVIEGCIISDKAVIKTGSILKVSLIGPNFVVVENTIKEKAHLSNSDGFMEIE